MLKPSGHLERQASKNIAARQKPDFEQSDPRGLAGQLTRANVAPHVARPGKKHDDRSHESGSAVVGGIVWTMPSALSG